MSAGFSTVFCLETTLLFCLPPKPTCNKGSWLISLMVEAPVSPLFPIPLQWELEGEHSLSNTSFLEINSSQCLAAALPKHKHLGILDSFCSLGWIPCRQKLLEFCQLQQSYVDLNQMRNLSSSYSMKGHLTWSTGPVSGCPGHN